MLNLVIPRTLGPLLGTKPSFYAKSFAIDLIFHRRIQNKIIASKNGHSKWCNSLKHVTFDFKSPTLAVSYIIKNFNISIVNNVLQIVNGIPMEYDAAKFIGISMGSSAALIW